MASVPEILTSALKQGASDVHLVAGMPPMFRLNTILAPADGFGIVDLYRRAAGHVRSAVRSVLRRAVVEPHVVVSGSRYVDGPEERVARGVDVDKRLAERPVLALRPG